MRPSILSVDDEEDVSSLLAFHLTQAGFHVRTATSGRAAIQAVEQARPDLILLDLMLPDIDGFGVCEILRRQPVTATIPIIILSAWASPDSRHVGLDLGAIDYLTKPFSPKQVVSRVQSLLFSRSS